MLEESTQAVNHPKDCIWKKKKHKNRFCTWLCLKRGDPKIQCNVGKAVVNHTQFDHGWYKPSQYGWFHVVYDIFSLLTWHHFQTPPCRTSRTREIPEAPPPVAVRWAPGTAGMPCRASASAPGIIVPGEPHGATPIAGWFTMEKP